MEAQDDVQLIEEATPIDLPKSKEAKKNVYIYFAFFLISKLLPLVYFFGAELKFFVFPVVYAVLIYLAVGDFKFTQLFFGPSLVGLTWAWTETNTFVNYADRPSLSQKEQYIIKTFWVMLYFTLAFWSIATITLFVQDHTIGGIISLCITISHAWTLYAFKRSSNAFSKKFGAEPQDEIDDPAEFDEPEIANLSAETEVQFEKST